MSAMQAQGAPQQGARHTLMATLTNGPASRWHGKAAHAPQGTGSKSAGHMDRDSYLETPGMSVGTEAYALPAALQEAPQLPLCLLAPSDHCCQPETDVAPLIDGG